MAKGPMAQSIMNPSGFVELLACGVAHRGVGDSSSPFCSARSRSPAMRGRIGRLSCRTSPRGFCGDRRSNGSIRGCNAGVVVEEELDVAHFGGLGGGRSPRGVVA